MSLYEFGPFQLDVERLLLLHGGEPVALGPKVVETLLALIEHPGEVLSKTSLLDRVWPEGFVEEANLAQNIYVLRKTLRTHWDRDAIETVPRRGYRFVAEVRLIEHVAHAQPEVVTARRGMREAIARYATLAAAFIVLTGLAFAVTTKHPQPPATTIGLSDNGARLYTIGRYYWNLRTRDGVEKSVQYFSQVIDSDPHSARGYAALAEANEVMGNYHYGPLKSEVYTKRAHAYAEKAIALDPNSAEGHAALGVIALDYKQMPLALRELRRALELDPQYGPAHEWYGIALLGRGDLAQALHELRTAADLDPLSVATTAWLGEAAYYDRRFNDAIAYSRQTLDLSPQRADAYATIGLAYEARGDFARAVDAFTRFDKICSDCHAEAAAYLAHVFALQHRMHEAETQLAFAAAHAKDVEPQDLAIAMAAVGHRTIALGMLRHMKSYDWYAIANDPRYDVLRDDKGFRKLARDAG